MWLLKSISIYTRWFLECLVNRTSPNSNLGSRACEALGIYYSLMTYNISAPLPLSSPDFMRVSTKRTKTRCNFLPTPSPHPLFMHSRSWKKSHRFQAPKLKSLRFSWTRKHGFCVSNKSPSATPPCCCVLLMVSAALGRVL